MRPSNDRIDNLIQGVQLLLEGGQTGVLLLGSYFANMKDDPQSLSYCLAFAFWLGLMGLFLPLAEKIYDAVITQVSTCVRNECDPKGAVLAWFALLLALPGTILGFIDFDLGQAENALGLADAVISPLRQPAAHTHSHALSLPHPLEPVNRTLTC
jgi:hypothetical protein